MDPLESVTSGLPVGVVFFTQWPSWFGFSGLIENGLALQAAVNGRRLQWLTCWCISITSIPIKQKIFALAWAKSIPSRFQRSHRRCCLSEDEREGRASSRSQGCISISHTRCRRLFKPRCVQNNNPSATTWGSAPTNPWLSSGSQIARHLEPESLN